MASTKKTADNQANIAAHYDAIDVCIEAMVDSFPKEGPPELYSCAFWHEFTPDIRVEGAKVPSNALVTTTRDDVPFVKTLAEANEIKLRTTASRLHLAPGMRVLDIGCGDGALAYFLATEYDVEVEGITLSEKQLQRACRRAEYTNGINFHLMDFNDVPEKLGKYDRVVSVGMMEHVGYANLVRYMQTVNQAMHSNGRALIHTIYRPKNTGIGVNPWIDEYIFPGGYIPSRNDLRSVVSAGILHTVGLHNIPGIHYAKTLAAWNERLIEKWPSIEHNFDDPEHIKRTMQFYLASCEGWFMVNGAVIQLELIPG